MNCTHCNTPLNADARFCAGCGTPQSDTPPAETPAASLSTPTASASTISNSIVSDLPLSSDNTALVPPANRPHLASPFKSLTPQEAHGLLTQANLHRIRREWSTATDACVAVLRADPSSQSAHSLLGDIYRDQGKTADAAQWYRMALELKDNGADRAKLRLTEEELSRKEHEPARTLAASSAIAAHLPDALETGPPAAGTTNLVGGVSPRRWLRAITAISLTFVVLVLAVLIPQQWSRNKGEKIKKVTIASSRVPSAASRNRSVPPSQVIVGNRVTAGPSGTGSGLPPDRGGEAVNPSLTSPRREASQREDPDGAAPSLATAQPTGVRPLSSGTGFGDEGASGSTPVAPGSNASLPAGLLPGGMQASVSGGLSGSIIVSAPNGYVGRGDAQTRTLLLRNLVRAAQMAFGSDPSRAHASVQIVAQPGNALLAQGTLERTVALTLNPDTDSPETLAARVQNLRLPDDTSAASPAPPTEPSALTGTGGRGD